MTRRAARTDANQRAIVEGLRAIPGVSVAVTSGAGDGFPDLVVGVDYRVALPHPGSLVGSWRIDMAKLNYLLEVKNPNAPPSDRKLTPSEAKFAENWRGQYDVIESLEDALCVLGLE